MPKDLSIRIRRGNSEQWGSENPILEEGELGCDINNVVRVGDASKNWSGLPESILAVNPKMENSSTKLNPVVMVSPVLDFKSVGETNLFTVPTGYVFSMEKIEVVTTKVESLQSAPHFRLGKSNAPSSFLSPVQSRSSNILSRHIEKLQQNSYEGNFTATFGITVASNASEHKGVAIVKGNLSRKEP